MPPFDFESWFKSLDPTDQWLLEWRAGSNLSLREIAEKSGLAREVVAERLLHLRDRLVDRIVALR
ncbi:MAG: hypothetical protein GX774_10355 [Armatimonadetes bacterium]|jgi:transcriptional regulator with XRE-family HTH domain|nr:hypothetical protein [Armatimonadota bacterium]